MNGTYNHKQSWLRQHVFTLENGWTATIESSYYGDMISCLEKDGYVWHCSNGQADLPEFAREWVQPIAPGHWQTLVRPLFNKQYN